MIERSGDVLLCCEETGSLAVNILEDIARKLLNQFLFYIFQDIHTVNFSSFMI